MKKMIGSIVLLILLGGVMVLLLGKLVLGPVVSGADATQSALTVRDTWARQAAAGENSAIYFILENRSKTDVRLTGVDCPFAEMAQVHETKMDGNTASMKPVEGGVPAAAGAQVVFQPGGLHLMLMNLRQPLEAGQSADCTLTFENAGPLAITAEVRKP